jgi:DNA-binding LytR/AlgR family response regulator
MKRLKLPESKEIIYLKGVVNYTEFYLFNGRMIVSSSTLKKHENVLDGFLRVSKSHLINPFFVKKVHDYEFEKEIELRNGNRVKVSRRRRDVLKGF